MRTVLGAEAARDAEETGDMSAWDEHCEELEGALMRVGVDFGTPNSFVCCGER